MRKTLLFALTALLVLSFAFALTACDEGGNNQVASKSVYKVTFFDNYVGGSDYTQNVEPGAKATKPADPARLGYSFAGWFDDYEAGAAFNFDSTINADVNVYAHWTKTENVINFKYNDGSEDKVVTVKDGEKVNKPADPASEEYEFIGWYLDAAYTIPFDFDAPITAPTVVYAGWSRSSVRLTFNLNYSGAPDPTVISIGVERAITVPETLELTRRLYAFDGWYLKSFPSATDAPVDLLQGVEEDTVLYAKWARTHYEVVFDPNERTMEKVTIEVPVDNPVAEVPELTRNGYSLDEVWYSEANLKTPYDLTNIGDDVIVYAKWNINYYDVTFSLNYDDAPDAPPDQSIAYRAYATRPDTPERDGYTFLGWFTDPEAGEQFNFEDSYVTTKLQMYAHWLENQELGGTIKVYFKYNFPGYGGETGVYQELEIDKGKAVTDGKMPAEPSIGEDKLFLGWYTDDKCKTAFDPAAILIEDTTVYARILMANVFEAEYVDLTNKHGVGSSVELNEEAMLFNYTKIGTGSGEGEEYVSNDWYVAGMYYKGAFIEFEITASRAIENAVLMMRVSSEFKTLHYNPLTPATYRIDINPEFDGDGEVTEKSNFMYELPLTLPAPNTDRENDPDGEKTPFADVIISYKFYLKQGKNVIRFTTNNYYDYGAGTFKANAPMIDCITIFTEPDVVLTMTEYTEFMDKKLGIE